ncbi:MAG: response regulator [Thaumarchaeota archaeon]|nr:MAG: response regulator [Nitrososphaerota archaeon]
MAQVKKRILIVDDEKDVGRTLKLILENFVFERFSTIYLRFTSTLVHGNACFTVFE